jgi:hypothetical protein
MAWYSDRSNVAAALNVGEDAANIDADQTADHGLVVQWGIRRALWMQSGDGASGAGGGGGAPCKDSVKAPPIGGRLSGSGCTPRLS